MKRQKDYGSSAVEVWIRNEARVDQQGIVTRCWAKKGTRPRVVRQRQYEPAYLFGAVCPAKDKAVGLVMPKVNTESMQLHLRLISQQIPEGSYAVLLLDRAGWHTSPKLSSYRNLFLMLLPPAAPELNPTEQVWQQLRDRYLANHAFEDYEAIVESYGKAWKSFTATKSAIKKLCTRQWVNLQL